MIYGYERDEAAIDPTDWRSILKMIESGMSQEEIDSQLAMNEVRNDVKKVAAFAPEGEQLAYITPEEQGILKMLGGSGEKEPVTGIKSLKKSWEKDVESGRERAIRQSQTGRKYDKAVSAIVRETLTIVEGFYVEQSQRFALRRLIRKSIYGITDNLKKDLVEEFSAEENDA